MQKLQQDFAKILATPEIRAMYLNFGFEPGGATPVDFAAVVRADSQRYADYIRKIGYKAE